MKNHILVATDGSDTAMNAVVIAAEIAGKFDVPLTIGHVLQFGRPSAELRRMADVEHIVESVKRTSDIDFEIMSGSGGGDLFASSRPSSDTVRAVTLIGDEILRRAVSRAEEAGATKVTTATTNDDPADGVLDLAREAGADMIIIGHRGLGRIRTLLMGSVAQKVNQHAECSVLTVR